MKTILWTQNENTSIRDTFIIDQQFSDSTIDNQEAFSILTQASKNLSLSPKERNRFAEEFKFTEQTNYSEGRNWFYIQGCFEEKDDRGRNLPYMFFTCECHTLNDAIELLIKYSKLIGRNCNKQDLEILTKYRELKKKTVRLIVLMSVIIITTLILWMLTK